MSLATILKKYVDIKMFDEEQYKFKIEFFKELFDPYEEIDYTKRSPIFINAILEEENLPYIVSIRKEKEDGDNKNKKYWFIIVL